MICQLYLDLNISDMNITHSNQGLGSKILLDMTYFCSMLLYTVCMWVTLICSWSHNLFPPVRLSASSTVLRHRGTLRITKTSTSWCCVPTSATTCAWAENSWRRSPRRLSERPGDACRRDVTWTWCTTSAHTLLTPTSLVRLQPRLKMILCPD